MCKMFFDYLSEKDSHVVFDWTSKTFERYHLKKIQHHVKFILNHTVQHCNIFYSTCSCVWSFHSICTPNPPPRKVTGLLSECLIGRHHHEILIGARDYCNTALTGYNSSLFFQNLESPFLEEIAFLYSISCRVYCATNGDVYISNSQSTE